MLQGLGFIRATGEDIFVQQGQSQTMASIISASDVAMTEQALTGTGCISDHRITGVDNLWALSQLAVTPQLEFES